MRTSLQRIPKAAAGALVSILLMIIAGVVGNRADHLAVAGFPLIAQFLSRQIPVWWVLPFLLGIAGLGFLRVYIQAGDRADTNQQIQHMLEIERAASKRSDQLVRMGDSLLRLLARLQPGANLEAEFERLLEEYLRDATGVFEGDVARGMILIRKESELIPWVGFQMPVTTMKRSRFRLDGEGVEARGIATLAYRSETPVVVHFRMESGRMISDAPNDYVVFDNARPFPPYRSFIALPIPGEPENIGVLCFDSAKVDAFDSPQIQALLGSMSAQIDYAVEIYRRMSN